MNSQSDRLCKKLKLIDTCGNCSSRLMVVASLKDIKNTFDSKIGQISSMNESLGNKENRICSRADPSYLLSNSQLCLRMP